ncbi:hypothetical protein AAFF_G00356750 [Aldrovandia affinis]|uniref:Uncharacterized protein n=1 Tax=Aldrovandia affinis TaxID=143900 RepID=A0AAD7T8S3_9TELE|nr:hypothetical protein AAFF_G00356750 [Aldrovandia affinis]
MLMDYEEGLYNDEEMFMENEEDHYYEEDLFIENEDLYGEEEIPVDIEEAIEKVKEEVSLIGLEEEELSVDRDLDYEVEMILGGIDKAFDEVEEGPEKGKRESFRKMEADLCLKEKEEDNVNNIRHHEGERASCSEKEVDISEGGKAFQEEDKEPWEEGESVKKGGRDNTPTTESLPDEETDLHMSEVKYARKQGLNSQTTTAISQTTPRSGNGSPLVRIRHVFLSSTNESVNEHSEAREDPNSPQADLSPIEEAGYRTTVNLPPVEKVETVARNDSSRCRDLLSHNPSRAALYALVCVVFFVTAFQYDFLSCFAFYLITVYWLYIHGEKKRLQDGIGQVEDNKR